MRKLSYEYIIQYFEDQGCELLEKEYINNNTKMRYLRNCKKKIQSRLKILKRVGGVSNVDLKK